MRLIPILLICLSAYAEDDVYIERREKSIPEEIDEIASLMEDAQEKMRNDRSDKIVQLNGDEIIERIDKLIKEAEAATEKDKETERKHHLLLINGKRQPNRKPPRVADTTDPKASIPQSKDDAEWARLPRSQRGEIIQAWSKDIPLVWKERISAYFISVNAENSAREESKKK